MTMVKLESPYLQNSVGRMSIGFFTGTGALVKVNCGFTPKRVQLYNWAQPSYAVWMFGAPYAASLGREGTGLIAFDLEQGITPVEGDEPGFTVGNLAWLNIVSELVFWIAWG